VIRTILIAAGAICIFCKEVPADPVRIPKSVADLIPGFEERVSLFRREKAAWDAQEQAVAGWAGKPDDPGKPARYPPPRDLTAVMIAAGTDGFEVFDDGPTPAERLERRKAILLNQIGEAERVALEAIVPAAKRRQFDIRQKEIEIEDERRLTAFDRVRVFFGTDEENMKARRRPTQDNDFLKVQRKNRAKISDVQRSAAGMMAEVSDLPTIEAAESWQIRPLLTP
jgi:hypothetical protein